MLQVIMGERILLKSPLMPFALSLKVSPSFDKLRTDGLFYLSPKGKSDRPEPVEGLGSPRTDFLRVFVTMIGLGPYRQGPPGVAPGGSKYL